MTEVNQETRVAVFFDYENIVYSLRNRFEQKANFDALITKCKEFGRLTVAKAFADWGLPYMSPALMYALQSSGFELVFVPTGSTQSNSPRKNVADLYMAISVMDVLYNRPDIDTYVLLTGDRDFMVLVNHLKQCGKHVIAIGVDGSSSYYLTQAVDDFFYYSEVEEIFEDQPKRQKGRPTNIYDALQQAVQVMREKGRTPRLTNLKPIMVELMGNFDEKTYTDSKGRNFVKFKDFVQEAQRRGTVRLLRRGSSIEVHLPQENIDKIRRSKPADDAVEDSIKLENAHKLLAKAIREVDKKGKPVRVGPVRTQMKKLLASFDVASIESADGDFPYAKFDEFIAASVEDGIILQSGEGPRRELALPTSDSNDEVEEVESEESELRVVEGEEARAAILSAIRAYQNYPTSFLSLAGFVHRNNESNGISVGEVEARELMTEAVKGDLLQQIVLDDGRRQYELKDSAELVAAFLGQEDFAEVDIIEDDAEESGDEAQQVDEAPSFATPYEGLMNAVRTILADGKDPVLPRVKSTMVNLMGSFNEKELTDSDGNHFAKFKDFVVDAEKRGHVRLDIDGNINRVFLADGAGEAAPAAETESDAPESDEMDSIADDLIAADDVADAVADAMAEAQVVETARTKVAPPEAAPVEEEDNGSSVGEPEQRKVVIDALRSFSSYPAPFMGILAHCRTVRNEAEIRITSADLRDMLSETVRVGLLNISSKQGRRPSRYEFAENETLAQQYINQEIVEVVEEPAAEEAPAQAEAATPAAAEQSAPAAPEASPEASDRAVRQLIADAVAAFDDYPAAYADVLNAVKTAQAAAELDASDKRVRNLLSAATRGGVLTITTPRGVRPTKYAYTNDAAAVASYVGPEETAAAEPAAEATAEAPAAESATTAIDVSGLPEETAAFVTAVQAIEADGEDALMANVKKRMKKLIKGFDEKKYTDAKGKAFKKFKDFADDRVVATGLAELVKSGRTSKVVLLPQSAAPAPAVETAPAEEAAVETVEASAPAATEATSELDQAFALLVQAVTAATESNGSRKLPGIKTRLQKLDPSLDIKQLKGANGKGFKGIGTFVRAAADAGHVVVSGKGMAIEVSLP